MVFSPYDFAPSTGMLAHARPEDNVRLYGELISLHRDYWVEKEEKADERSAAYALAHVLASEMRYAQSVVEELAAADAGVPRLDLRRRHMSPLQNRCQRALGGTAIAFLSCTLLNSPELPLGHQLEEGDMPILPDLMSASNSMNFESRLHIQREVADLLLPSESRMSTQWYGQGGFCLRRSDPAEIGETLRYNIAVTGAPVRPADYSTLYPHLLGKILP